MDIFQENQKLEQVIFSGLDYALYTRHDLEDTFMPFMMLYKDGKAKLVRVAAEGNPIEAFEDTLKKDNEQYEQIVMCLEGRIPHEGEKHDAIFVRGFDTSQEQGLMFLQRFRGKESGQGFQKLGNPALVSNKEELPVPLVNRDSFKTVEDPYLQAVSMQDDNGKISREIFAGHENASYLANKLFNGVLNILSKEEPEFSGTFKFNFVPGLLPLGPYTEFIFDQLVMDIKQHPNVKAWENSTGKTLKIELKYNKEEAAKPEATEAPTNTTEVEKPDYSNFTKEELDDEYQRIIAVPNARTNIKALTDMSELMKEYKKRGIAMPGEKQPQSNNKENKPWWKFW